ncbi:hypothetical protein [Streptomyces sp. MZ04]|uniref:hypothetical protein n=1 Tax=Streptomyces sp. MZ04 TaxID=2559236 RepID=UPI00107EA5A7|nr:hypothetical protein [Streptomyces sp. MZ04]TGB00575.1 hypothetical protein E2651_28745 [Streptomyces sp. MZ04]
MTSEGLTGATPVVTVALCIKCTKNTSAPVAVRWIHSTSGPGATLYACPECAPELGAGPTPDDEIPTP